MTVAILYATVSGNAEALAHEAGRRLEAAGVPSVVENMADFPPARLQEFDHALFIASTWGEGAPPPEAAAFCAAWQEPTAPRLPRLHYAVFALGSANYRNFCGCGRQLDEDLARAGASRLLPCALADTKFKEAFEKWLGQATLALTAGETAR
jgi:sulfite reductase (NADPH) flavoprotein alpha-component